MKFVLFVIALFFTSLTCAQSSIQKEMQMMKDGEKQVSFIDSFAKKSKEKDFEGVYAMLDVASLNGANPSDVKAYLEKVVFPFFAEYEKLHNYKQITNATLPDGRSGLWHYTYIFTTSGKVLPFRIAVIDGADGPKTLAIEVNKCIQGRHPTCSL